MEDTQEKKYKYNPKELFEKRIEILLPDKKDREEFWKISHTPPIDSIRCNTLKISPQELKNRLEKYGWKLKELSQDYPEILIIQKESNLKPGELGKSVEHLLGYYYVQDISSMMPMIALHPTETDFILDLCASPGSKTTQAGAMMNNKGTIVANEVSLGRIAILNSNLERCGVSNTIVVKKDGVQFCKKAEKEKIQFDKILVDAPCSGEGTLRKSPKTFNIWNLKVIEGMAKIQKKLTSEALKILKVGGEMIYSTCTLSPEENEEVVNFLKKNFDVAIEKPDIPMKFREGLTEWKEKKFDTQLKNCCRIYPQDNNSDGFFLAKLKKIGASCQIKE
jgi:NOL1/NOP2/sun family putative RNA methylase